MRFLVPVFLFLIMTLGTPAAADADRGGLLAWWNAGTHALQEHWLKRLRGGAIRVPIEVSSDGSGVANIAEALQVDRYLWRGRWAAIATSRDDYDPLLMQSVLDAVDRFCDRCAELAGNSPPPIDPLARAHRFHLLIVEERGLGEGIGPPPRGGAHGTPGAAWVTAAQAELEAALRAAGRGDRVKPLGDALPAAVAETYFFFQPQLALAAAEGSRAPAAAYAFLLTGRAAEDLGWALAPDARPLEALADRFRANDTAWSDAPDGSTPSDVDVWTAILLRLQHASGDRDFVERLWRVTMECPIPATPDEAIANLVVAASGAARADLTPQFARWGFLMDPALRFRVQEAIRPSSMVVPGR